jgi:hypothetical protein
MKAFVGNSLAPIYSCSLLQITGGNPNMKCAATAIQDPTCEIAGSPGYSKMRKLINGGKFCYQKKGSGNIDTDIAKQPFNYKCDPRVGCENIAVAPKLCAADITLDIIDPFVHPHVVCGSGILLFTLR